VAHSAAVSGRANVLRLRRLRIDTYQEPVLYMHRDSHVCRSEGFEAQSRVELLLSERTIVATLNVVSGDFLAPDEAGLSEAAWRLLHRFPDGEALVRIDVPVKGRCVVLAGSLDRPDEKTLPLLFAADAARELGAAQVGLAAPYLAYMRQDRRFNPGKAITSLSYAPLLSSSW
jgi:hypothetical protein